VILVYTAEKRKKCPWGRDKKECPQKERKPIQKSGVLHPKGFTDNKEAHFTRK
jgi:hypothetical protein